MTEKKAILAVNVGSSSIKFSMYLLNGNCLGQMILKGHFDNLIVGENCHFEYKELQDVNNESIIVPQDVDRFDFALDKLVNVLNESFPLLTIIGVSHRVVHGGDKYFKSVEVNKEVLDDLVKLSPLAPLHQPHNIDGIAIFSRYFPKAKQVACFDTAFHRTLPNVEKFYSLPLNFAQEGVMRYGFHGLSYQFVSSTIHQLTPRANNKMVMLHLGNGASGCACIGLKSVATTMGFSTIEGLMMGTRSGAIDPGVIFYLLRKGWVKEQIEDLLYNQSGLKGVSGISSDMKLLRKTQTVEARFAIDMYCHQIVKQVGGLIALMNGIDVLVFTGGIGEHDFLLREEVIKNFSYLEIELDNQKNKLINALDAKLISTDRSKVEVWVVPTDEERVAAQNALEHF